MTGVLVTVRGIAFCLRRRGLRDRQHKVCPSGMWRRRYGIVIVHARNVPGPRSRANVSWQVHAELLTKGCTVGEGHLFKLLKCYTKERMWTDAMQIYGQLTAEFDMLANSVRRRKRLTSSCRGPEGGGHNVVVAVNACAGRPAHNGGLRGPVRRSRGARCLRGGCPHTKGHTQDSPPPPRQPA